MKTLGGILKEARINKGLSLRDVQKQIGITSGHLSQIENGKIQYTSGKNLEKLYKFYDLDYTKHQKYGVPDMEKFSFECLPLKSLDESERVYSQKTGIWYYNGEEVEPQSSKITGKEINKHEELNREGDFLTVLKAQELNTRKLINMGMYPSDQMDSIYPDKKKYYIPKGEIKEYSVIELYDEVQSAIRELFVNKNEEYGSLFMKFNRPLMRNEIKRKWERYETLFTDTNNTTEMMGDQTSIIPTMVDLANYAIMTIINELHNSKLDEKELHRIKNSIISGISK